MHTRRRQPRARRGTVLIVALIVTFALAGLVLALGRTVRVELAAAANAAAAARADAAARGAEQLVLGLLAEYPDGIAEIEESEFAGIQVGDALVWVLRPDYGDPDQPQFGLVDESGKLDLNRASRESLARLPGMTEEIAASVVDWRDADDAPTDGGGAESPTYLGSTDGYRAKNASFENVEELLMVRGMTRDLLYGQPDSASSRSLGNDRYVTTGLFDDLTIWSRAHNPTGSGQVRGRVNVNAASREVLMTLPGLSDADADALIARRAGAVATDPYDVRWVAEALPEKAGLIQNQIVGRGFAYSADIVAASADGRAFRRVRIVVDTSSGTPSLVYRRDLTERGWPMDPAVLQELRSGQGTTATAGGTR